MDSYVDLFQANGGSFVMLAKGNRSKVVTDACKAHGGFYLGSIGGPAARLAKDCITKVEVLEYPELGMEAVWKIEVRDFPAFIVVDDKGQRLLQRSLEAGGDAMKQVFVFERVAVIVMPWHEPMDPPERGTRVEIRLLGDEPPRGSRYAAERVVLDEPLFRADLFDQMTAPPGNLHSAHYHPNFHGIEPCDRVWSDDLKQDAVGLVGGSALRPARAARSRRSAPTSRASRGSTPTPRRSRKPRPQSSPRSKQPGPRFVPNRNVRERVSGDAAGDRCRSTLAAAAGAS